MKQRSPARRRFSPRTTRKSSTPFEVCILAGGLSERMGRNKEILHVRAQSLLAHVRNIARPFGKARVVRKDRVQHCGPLGGIITALKSSRARAVVFLACDMPFVSGRLLHDLIEAGGGAQSVFATQNRRVGFPFVIPVAQLPAVEMQVACGRLSLQRLARALKATRVSVSRRDPQLFNVNTPDDLLVAQTLYRETSAKKRPFS